MYIPSCIFIRMVCILLYFETRAHYFSAGRKVTPCWSAKGEEILNKIPRAREAIASRANRDINSEAVH